jgi:hypothetical protein
VCVEVVRALSWARFLKEALQICAVGGALYTEGAFEMQPTKANEWLQNPRKGALWEAHRTKATYNTENKFSELLS